MNGIDYLADTNAILYYLSGHECMKVYKDSRFACSIISEMELLSYQHLSEAEEESIRGFLESCELLSVSKPVREKTIEIRKKYAIKLPDAIIASSAIVNDLVLLTADKGFERVKELKLNLLLL